MSQESEIPDDVRRFISLSVPSVPYLEAALFLRRQGGSRCTAEQVARALYIPPRAAADLLQAQCDAGLLACEGDQFWYAADDALDHALGRLADCYASNLVAVTKLIHDATQQNAQRFADAFRWKRKS